MYPVEIPADIILLIHQYITAIERGQGMWWRILSSVGWAYMDPPIVSHISRYHPVYGFNMLYFQWRTKTLAKNPLARGYVSVKHMLTNKINVEVRQMRMRATAKFKGLSKDKQEPLLDVVHFYGPVELPLLSNAIRRYFDVSQEKCAIRYLVIFDLRSDMNMYSMILKVINVHFRSPNYLL